LSLQVHPSRGWAERRFAEEQDAGVAKDDPCRLYQDSNHKPELFCALTIFRALCGFAPIEETTAMLNVLGGDCAHELAARLAGPANSSDNLQSLISQMLRRTLDVGPIVSRCREVVARSEPVDDHLRQKFKCCIALADMYPADPAAVISLLMNLVTLRRGDSIRISAGVLHAYLDGAGVEVMSASDNVLRAGLTPKLVAVDELLQVVDFRSVTNPVISTPSFEHLHTYESPSDDFQVTVIRCYSKKLQHPVKGPELLVCVSGELTVRSRFTTVILVPGDAAFVMACARTVTIEGTGELFVATTGKSARIERSSPTRPVS
jgi:mannose-6-phosphate isomerase